jgi:alpha-tubulin suppressor-like RCC1 family protein
MKKIIIILAITLYFANGNAQCFKSVSSSQSFTIGIKTNGTLWAWGRNDFGQLGDGTTVNKTTPTQIGTATNWQTVSTGTNHSLAIKTDGTLWAWGVNSSGQLGNNSTTNSLIPIQVGTANNWQSISAGGEFSLALRTNNTLWAWGDNFYKQLGLGTFVPNQLAPVQVGSDADWYLISAGSSHSLAVKLSGPLYSWGSNTFGLLGIGSSSSTGASTPTLVPSSVPWKSISAGSLHNVAIKDDNTLWAWGTNDFGQLGDNTWTIRTSPIQIGLDTNWLSAVAGSSFSAAMKTTNTLWTWGLNNKGQLGDNTLINKQVPTQLGTSNSWTTVSAGGWQVIARSSPTIFATNTSSWGNNEFGQLGDGTTTNRLVPTLINNCSALANETFSQNQFKVYPNPASTILNIDNQYNMGIEKIKIINFLGKTVLIENSNFDVINIEKLATGMYVLEISTHEKTFTNKFIKQ